MCMSFPSPCQRYGMYDVKYMIRVSEHFHRRYGKKGAELKISCQKADTYNNV
jgi:hypothetical protein